MTLSGTTETLEEMAISPPSSNHTEEWIREAAPSLAFHSKGKGGGFIGKRLLKPLLVAKAAKEFKEGFDPEAFDVAFESLCKKGLLKQLIQNGKPKRGNQANPSASTKKTQQPTVDLNIISEATSISGAGPSIEVRSGAVPPSVSPQLQRIQLARTPSSASNNQASKQAQDAPQTPQNILQAPSTSLDSHTSPYLKHAIPVNAFLSVKSPPPVTAPMRFGPATAALRTPALVTPGGSLTAETAKDLAAFGGAVIRRGAKSQISIALPPSRERRSYAAASAPSPSTFTNIGASHKSSNLARPASVADVPDESMSPQSDVGQPKSWTHDGQSSPSPKFPQEPVQHWKSLEVSLVDASLLRGFEPSFVPELTSPITPFAAPNFLPIVPEQQQRNSPSNGQSSSSVGGARGNSSVGHGSTPPQHTPETTVSTHSFTGPKASQIHKQQSYTSPANESAYLNRPLPATPAQIQEQASAQHRQTPEYTHPNPQNAFDQSTTHQLSRGMSALSPHITYRPPLQLAEISVPYKVQFHILSLLLTTSEFVFHDFSSKWFPEILQDNSWDCPEAADSSMWSKAILKALNNASEEVNYSSSGSSSGGVGESSGTGGPETPPRIKISRKPPAHALAHLTSLLMNMKELNMDVRYRRFISGEKLLWHLDNSMRVCSLLGCNQRAVEIEEITYYVKEALGGIGIVRDAVRGLYNERVETINRKREELARLEREAWEEASSVEREECLKLGWDLAMALDLKIENLKWSGPGSPSMPQDPAGRGGAGMPASWGEMKKMGFGIGIGEMEEGHAGARGGGSHNPTPAQAGAEYFPDQSASCQPGELDRLTQQLMGFGNMSIDVKGKGKEKSPWVEPEVERGLNMPSFNLEGGSSPHFQQAAPDSAPRLSDDRGRVRASSNVGYLASTANASSNSNAHSTLPTPPPIPPRHKHRLSTGLFPTPSVPSPSNSEGEASDTDVDDEPEGTGGGVELSLSQQRLFHYQAGTSSTTRSALRRNNTAPQLNLTKGKAEISLDASVDMVKVREPVPVIGHKVVSISGIITTPSATTTATTTANATADITGVDSNTEPSIIIGTTLEVTELLSGQSKVGIVRSSTAPSAIKASDGLTQIFLEHPAA